MSTLKSDIRWIENIGAAYQHALVCCEIARQDLAVAVAEKDAMGMDAAQQVFSEWRERRVHLEKLLEGALFMRKKAGS